ncbi:MAG: magnesium transporter [Clostridia bacterium]
MTDRMNNIEQIAHYVRSGEIRGLYTLLEDLHPADIAEILLALDEEERKGLFRLLPKGLAALVLNELDSDYFEELIGYLDLKERSQVLDEMSPDDMVDILSELSDDRQSEILGMMNVEEARDVRELLDYDEDSAGGIMTKEYVAIRRDITVEEAIKELRYDAPDAETIYYVYVVDHENRLVGVVSLRELIVSQPNTLIENIMREKVISVELGMDQEDVARKVAKYDLLAIPVVDHENRLMGIVTVDDILDVIEEEASEDIFRFAGAVEAIGSEDKAFFAQILFSVKSRLPWLIITLLGGMVSSQIINRYSSLIQTYANLAAYMPLLAGMGGNVGTQSSTLTVRAIAIGQIDRDGIIRNIIQESLVGLLVGLVCGLGVAFVTLFQPQKDALIQGGLLAFMVGFAMCCNMVTAAAIGTMVPLAFKRFGIDPAVASAPFISTTIDVTGLSIYFGLITFMLSIFFK